MSQKASIVDVFLQKRNERIGEVRKKATEYLNKRGYFKLSFDDKKDFLCSDKGLTIVEGLAKENLMNIEIASTFQITQRQFLDICKEKQEVYDALDRGRQEKFDEIELALHEAAKGYYVNEERITTTETSRGRQVEKKEVYKRYIPGNYLAMQFILTNKRNLEYKRNVEDISFAEKDGVVFKICLQGNEQDGE